MQIELNNITNRDIQKPLSVLSEKLVEKFPSQLKSITVTGSVLTEDYVPSKSGINTVLVFDDDGIEIVEALSDLSKILDKYKFDVPLIMTEEHIESSQDVFGVEYLDFQLNHKTIYGKSPFTKLNIQKSDVRLQCERELKSSLIRLRQGFITSKLESALIRDAMIKDIIICTARGIVPYLRGMLWLCDKSTNPLIAATIEAASEQFDFDGGCLKDINNSKYAKKGLPKDKIKPSAIYLYNLIDSLASIVEKYRF